MGRIGLTHVVIPAQAGIDSIEGLDSRLPLAFARVTGNDGLFEVKA